jgi:hypothetical protein
MGLESPQQEVFVPSWQRAEGGDGGNGLRSMQPKVTVLGSPPLPRSTPCCHHLMVQVLQAGSCSYPLSPPPRTTKDSCWGAAHGIGKFLDLGQ